MPQPSRMMRITGACQKFEQRRRTWECRRRKVAAEMINHSRRPGNGCRSRAGCFRLRVHGLARSRNFLCEPRGFWHNVRAFRPMKQRNSCWPSCCWRCSSPRACCISGLVEPKPFGIILFVGEGLVTSKLAAARLYDGGADRRLAIDSLPQRRAAEHARRRFRRARRRRRRQRARLRGEGQPPRARASIPPGKPATPPRTRPPTEAAQPASSRTAA